jgi:hypothetical protein
MVIFPLSVGLSQGMAHLAPLNAFSPTARSGALTALLILGMEFAIIPGLERLMRRLFVPARSR